jgi:hypothetical protein
MIVFNLDKAVQSEDPDDTLNEAAASEQQGMMLLYKRAE